MISTPLGAYKKATTDALGFPCIMLLASMTGFGSLARESGFSLGMALATTAGIWGLPGQVALAELHVAGVGALFAILASSLANARFMPMAVSIVPLMRDGVRNYGWMYSVIQLMSINSWTAGQNAFPEIRSDLRVRYFVLFAIFCMAAGLIGTAIGYFGLGAMPPSAALGLIFLNPLFFAVLVSSTRVKPAIIAILIGIPLGPIFHMISPEWGLLATGVVGGTLAWWIYAQVRKGES